MAAKQETAFDVIGFNKNISDELAQLIKIICQDAIRDFDKSKHTIKDFVNLIRDKLIEKSNRADIHWFVYLFVGDEQGDWSGTKLLYKLIFGNLIIVIGGRVKRKV